MPPLPLCGSLAQLLQTCFEEWVVTEDTTYKVMHMQHSLTFICAVVHRFMNGTWRRTGWPLAVGVQPGRESTASYAKLEDCFHSEQRRRGLPEAKQVNTDWFEGVGTGFGVHARGIEHCVRNMDRNNRQGRAREHGALPRRRRKKKKSATPIQRQDSGGELALEDDTIAKLPKEPETQPHLKFQTLSCFVAFLYESLFVPTRHIFVSFLHVLLWKLYSIRIE